MVKQFGAELRVAAGARKHQLAQIGAAVRQFVGGLGLATRMFLTVLALSPALSVAFTARMSAALESEPHLLAPAAAERVLDALWRHRRLPMLLLPSSGIDALAAPVFDHMGKTIGVICTFGRAGAFDSRLTGKSAQILTEATTDLSRQFGFAEGALVS